MGPIRAGNQQMNYPMGPGQSPPPRQNTQAPPGQMPGAPGRMMGPPQMGGGPQGVMPGGAPGAQGGPPVHAGGLPQSPYSMRNGRLRVTNLAGLGLMRSPNGGPNYHSTTPAPTNDQVNARLLPQMGYRQNPSTGAWEVPTPQGGGSSGGDYGFLSGGGQSSNWPAPVSPIYANPYMG